MSRPGSRRRTLLVSAAIAAVQALAIFAYLRIDRARHAEPAAPFASEPATGPALPEADFVRSDGKLLRTAQLRGHPVLLHFWATWCAPCRSELPGVLQLARSEPELRVVALSLDESWPVVHTFFAGAIPLEVVRETGGSLADRYAVDALPTSYLFARDGAPALRFTGARHWQSAGARSALAPFLASR